jgi:hypothetical protein
MLKRKSEQFLDLTGEDDHGDTSGETDRHGKGDELDEGPKAEEAYGGEH